MIYEIKIKLESPMLGQMEDGTKVKRFERTKDQDFIILSNEIFRWAVEEAVALLRWDNLISTVYMVEIMPIKRPTLILYNRTYKDKISGNKKVTAHECIRSGAVLTMDLLTLNNLPKSAVEKNLKPPTKEEMQKIFEVIGKFFSISPWGSYTGKYGRFSLISFEEKQI